MSPWDLGSITWAQLLPFSAVAGGCDREESPLMNRPLVLEWARAGFQAGDKGSGLAAGSPLSAQRGLLGSHVDNLCS